MPDKLLVEISDDVILTVYRYKLDIASKKAERIENLYALADRHIGVFRAVKQKERGVDLVGIEKRALSGEEFGIAPGI